MKTMKKLTAVLLAVLFVFSPLVSLPFELPVFAATSGTTGDCTWTLDGTVLTISGNGKMGDYYSWDNSTPWGQNITQVIIEDGVTSIGDGAFYQCNLTDLTIGNSVTSIGDGAFYNCVRLTSITIPGSVTSIGEYAFDLCFNLKCVYINDLKAWCEIDFTDYCANPLSNGGDLYINGKLASKLEIPQGTSKIGNYAFVSYKSLTAITIPDSVTSIGDDAFSHCHSLTSITIPDGVTSIGDNAFLGINPLSLYIPKSVKSIGENVIGDEYQTWTGVVYYEGSPVEWQEIAIDEYNSTLLNGPLYYNFCKGGAHTFSSDCDRICDLCFFERSTWKPHSFDSVTGLCQSCSAHKDLYFALNSEGTGYIVLDCDTGAKGDLIIPENYLGKPVVAIGDSAFHYCHRLTSVTIPDSVTSIETYAFRYCHSLTSVTIPDSVSSIGMAAFDSCESLTDLILPKSITSLSTNAFAYCSSLASVTIPYSVTSIGSMAFYECSALTSVVIPDSVTSIGYDAFRGCTSLKTLCFSAGVEVVEKSAFEDCPSLTDVWYSGTESDLEKVNYQPLNNALVFANWHFNMCAKDTHKFDGNGICTVCGIDRVLLHVYDNACDPDCNLCGAVRVVKHAFVWEKDAEGHFGSCSVCGAKSSSSKAAHRYDNGCDMVCNDCDFIRPVTHSYTIVDRIDSEYRMLCAHCGDEDLSARRTHFFTDENDPSCNECGFIRPMPGQLDANEGVDMDDAIYLLFYTSFPEDYPINQIADYDSSGEVDMDDAIYLLFYTSFPEDYPLL